MHKKVKAFTRFPCKRTWNSRIITIIFQVSAVLSSCCSLDVWPTSLSMTFFLFSIRSFIIHSNHDKSLVCRILVDVLPIFISTPQKWRHYPTFRWCPNKKFWWTISQACSYSCRVRFFSLVVTHSFFE